MVTFCEGPNKGLSPIPPLNMPPWLPASFLTPSMAEPSPNPRYEPLPNRYGSMLIPPAEVEE